MNQHFKSVLVVLGLTFSLVLNGQLNYKSGYIITLTSDTLFGLIDDGGGNRNAKLCLFKQDPKSEVVRYLPGDIKSYRFIGEKYYSSQEVLSNQEYKVVFTEVLLEGSVNLYHSRKNNELAYYLDKGDGRLIGLLNKKAEVPISSAGLFGLQNERTYAVINSEKFDNQLNTSVYIDIYKDTLFSVFRESEKVQNQIDSIAYTEKSLIKITKSYINETCFDPSCISYEKNLRLYRPRFGIYSGVQMSKIAFKGSGLKSKPILSSPFAVFCNFPLKQISDNLSFQIEVAVNGFTYAQNFVNPKDTINYLYIKSWSVGVPLLLKYQVSGIKWSPSFAIGKELGLIFDSDVLFDEHTDMVLHRNKKGAWFCEAGMDYKIGPHLSLFSNLRFQGFSNLVISNKYSTRSSYKLMVDYDHFFRIYKTNALTLQVGIKF
jgi:hypothetical protein